MTAPTVPTVCDMASETAAVAAADNPFDPDNLAAPGTDLATVDETAVEQVEKPEPLDPDWKYERLEYKGDNLAVRKPALQALAAFQLASGKYITEERQSEITSLFVDCHLGPDSYDCMMQRLIRPDDPDYTTSSIGEIMGAIVKMAVDDLKKSSKDDATE